MKPETGHAISIYDTGIDVDEIGVIFAGDLPIGALYPLHRAEHAQRLQEAVNSHSALKEAGRALKAVLNSAVPNERDHPRMKAAWEEGHAALAELEKAGIKL